MANIAESFERSGNREFHQFLVVAKGSCAEVRSHLYLALDTGYLAELEFERLQQTAREVSMILGALRSAVDRRR
jgi:four helix bundle protein